MKKHFFILFFTTWLVLNLIQAAVTELFDDEAYYWVYSRFLDWGYFDHPPMIAVMIKWGYSLFRNEFGVRLLAGISSTLALTIIYHLLPRKNDRLFCAIACSMAVLQVGSIMAVPDIPLAFFTALFFLQYKQFLEKMSLLNSMLLGLVMALMLYSKYHGVLIIFFTLVSNPKLLLKYQAWMAVSIGALLFTPHLYWQYNNGFPSVQFHLFERNASAYSISFTLDYIWGQLLLAGPLLGWLVIWAAFKHKPVNAFEKALKFSLVGFYIFFLLSTLKGRVEANWTIPVFIPLIILSHQYLLTTPRLKTIVLRFAPVTLALVLAVRIYMMLDVRPIRGLPKDEFHYNRQTARSIYEKSNGLPAVFIDSYQKASKYWFYSGVMAYSLNTPTYRRNNFNFWPIEDSLYGKEIAAVDYAPGNRDIKVTPIEKADSIFTKFYYSFAKVKIECGKNLEVTNNVVPGYVLNIFSEDAHLKAFQSPGVRSNTIELWVLKNDTLYRRISTNIRLSSIRKNEQAFRVSLSVKLPAGEYPARFAIPSALMYPSLNSRTVRLKVR